MTELQNKYNEIAQSFTDQNIRYEEEKRKFDIYLFCLCNIVFILVLLFIYFIHFAIH